MGGRTEGQTHYTIELIIREAETEGTAFLWCGETQRDKD